MSRLKGFHQCAPQNLKSFCEPTSGILSSLSMSSDTNSQNFRHVYWPMSTVGTWFWVLKRWNWSNEIRDVKLVPNEPQNDIHMNYVSIPPLVGLCSQVWTLKSKFLEPKKITQTFFLCTVFGPRELLFPRVVTIKCEKSLADLSVRLLIGWGFHSDLSQQRT